MRDLMTGDRPGGGGLHGRHGGSLAVERRELDFERLPIRVDVNTVPTSPTSRPSAGMGSVSTMRSCSLIISNGHSLPGYAVTSRGAYSPRSMIQTVLIDHCRLS
jgi:hypothetical protein